MLQGELGFAEGEQDYESDDPEDLQVISWGMELEHMLAQQFGGHGISVFAAYQGLDITEVRPDGPDHGATDHTVLFGLRFRVVGMTPQAREVNSATDLPNIGRWHGLTPVVDGIFVGD